MTDDGAARPSRFALRRRPAPPAAANGGAAAGGAATVRRWADRYAAAAGYALGLVAGSAVLAARSSAGRTALLDWASTDRANLADHPVSALVFSAFLAESDLLPWLALALVGLGATGRVLGAWRTLLLVTTAHLVGTLVSEGILWYRIDHGLAPPGAVHLRDVGPSYLVVAALVAGLAYGRLPGRILAGTGFALLAPSLFGGLDRWEVAPLGHVCAIVLALGLGAVLRFTRAGRRRYGRAGSPPVHRPG